MTDVNSCFKYLVDLTSKAIWFLAFLCGTCLLKEVKVFQIIPLIHEKLERGKEEIT